MPAGYVGDASDEPVIWCAWATSSPRLNELKNMQSCSPWAWRAVDVVQPFATLPRVEITDNNAEDVFTKVNGEDGMSALASRSRAIHVLDRRTWPERITAENVEAALNSRIEGLSFVELMNQGDYIDIVVDSVLEQPALGRVRWPSSMLLLVPARLTGRR